MKAQAMSIYKRIHQVLTRWVDASVGEPLVVAVSGGVDSLALLHALTVIGPELRLRLHVATLDHRLRGDEGAADARAVADLARAWGLPVTIGAMDVTALMRERGVGVELAARLARYQFLASVAQAIGARCIITGHHADDQVETILMRALRGTGVRGLGGMRQSAPLPYHPDLTVVRPLLDVTRAELEAYCRQHGLSPRHDASNDALTVTRNRVRHEVLPLLVEVYPQARQSLLGLGTVARIEDDYLTQQLGAWMAEHVTREPGRIRAGRSAFAALHPALQGRLLLFAAEGLGSQEQAPGYKVIRAALDVAQTSAVGALAQLGAGLRLRVDYDAIVIERLDAGMTEDLPLLVAGTEFEIDLPATLSAADWQMVMTDQPLPPNVLRARIVIPDGARISARTRRRGDRFAPLGLGGQTQKLSKWLIDHKVPRHLRDQIPLILINGQIAAIVWGAGWPISALFAVGEQGETTAYLGLYRS